MQRLNITQLAKQHCFKNKSKYKTKTILVYVIYFVLNVSVETQILHVETIMLANEAQNKLNLTLVLYLTLRYEHLCTLVYKGTKLKYKEASKNSKCVKSKIR